MAKEALGTCVILVTIGFSSLALEAKQVKGSVSNAKFFYSMPAEANNDWAFAMPECAPLSASDQADFKKCSPLGKHEACESKKTVELSNVSTKQKKKFALIYHVFSSKDQCASDRNSALAGE